MGNCFAPSKARQDTKSREKMKAIDAQNEKYANYAMSKNMLNEQLMDDGNNNMNEQQRPPMVLGAPP